MAWLHRPGDHERLQQIRVAELKPLTRDNLAQLGTYFGERRHTNGTVQVTCESSRCASCKHHWRKGPKCVFCKQLVFGGQRICGPLRNATSAVNEQFPKDQPQCIGVEGSHEQPRSHLRAAQELEMSQLQSESLSMAFENPRQAGQESGKFLIPRMFCTQKCMLGLVKYLALDAECPNVIAHRQGLETDSHQINDVQLTSLLTNQLALDPNNGCTPLRLGTLPGRLHRIDKHVIFRITLISHGYTVVGKATQMATVTKLRREREAYLLLRKIQGKKVPVLLGDFYLVNPWTLRPQDVGPGSGSELVYMLLLSHVGRPINPYEAESSYNKRKIRKFDKVDMRGRGLHLDTNKIYTRNVIWNDELGRLMFIDFERVDFSSKWTAMISENESGHELHGFE